VRLSYRGHAPRFPGITITRSGGGSAEGYLTDASAPAFGTALARQYLADHRRGSYGTDGLFGGGTSVSLAGTPTARPPARPSFPMHTLTVKGLNLAGEPDTGDFVLLVNVDNTNLVDSITSVNTFFHGVAYNLYLSRTGTSGEPIVLEGLNDGNNPFWVNTTSVPPSVGTIRESVNEHLESPPGKAVPYEYTLSFTGPRGILPSEHHVVRPGQLATIHERFYQPVATPGQWAFSGAFPGPISFDNPEAFFGFVEPFGTAVRFPGRLTEFAGGGVPRAWSGTVSRVVHRPSTEKKTAACCSQASA